MSSMHSRWLGLACSLVAVSAAGCFDTHGMDEDAGRPSGLEAGPLPLDAPLPFFDGWPDPDAAYTCRAIAPTEVRTPRVLYEDQSLGVTMFAEGAGCGCRARIANDRAADSLAMELCECCEGCECVDLGYEVSSLEPAGAVGDRLIDTAIGPRPLHVASREDASFELEPTGLRAIPASDAISTFGVELRWLVVETTVSVCCVEPLVAIDEELDVAGVLHLRPRQLAQDDCACVGEPQTLEVWWPVQAGAGLVVQAGAHQITVGPF